MSKVVVPRKGTSVAELALPDRTDYGLFFLAVLLVALVLFLVDRYYEPTAPAVHTTQSSSVQGKSWSIHEVRLDDGTRCVISEGPQVGGIDCDWSTGAGSRDE